MAKERTRRSSRASDLEEKVVELEETIRSQERFVAHLAHELKTPLSTMLISLEVIERDCRGKVPPPSFRQFEILYRSARSLLNLTDNLLDFYKLQRGGLTPQPMPVVLGEFVQDLLGDVEPMFSKKNLYLRSEIAPEIPPLFITDPEILSRILLNLLINAFKFTERGGASLLVRGNDDFLSFTVADTGLGIPRSDIKSIFEEFRRLRETDARRRSGTGLGLPIACRFADLLGGRIEVDSVEGQGSRFSVILPLEVAPLEP